jgi:hypothetical protein
MLPYTVLKISNASEGHIEVAGEFSDEAGANKFVKDSQLNDPDNEHEYSVEVPPSQLVDPEVPPSLLPRLADAPRVRSSRSGH